jgi:signal transduction histidine kinase
MADNDGMAAVFRRMREPRLGTLLIASNVAATLLAVGLAGWVGIGLLRRLADQEARERVRTAGQATAEAVERAGGRLAASAQLLAALPSLPRLAARRDATALGPFLERFRATSGLAGCAVVDASGVVAQAGEDAPWDELVAAAKLPGTAFLHAGPGGAGWSLYAMADVPDLPGARVAVRRGVDETLARTSEQRAGASIAIVDPAETATARAESHRDPRVLARRTGESAVGRSDDGSYLAVVPIAGPSGQIVALVESTLPASVAREPARQLARTLIVLTAAIAAVAAFAGLVLARRVARPLGQLTAAAARIGRGDLSAPVPRAPGSEIGTLSSAMEDMRARILELMNELRRRQVEAETVVAGIAEGVYAVDRERRIRFLNPQAATLLGIDGASAIGRFCGDVLNPRGPNGVRPCEEDCPILHARFRGNSRARELLALGSGESRSVMITSSPPAADSGGAPGGLVQFQVLRDETDVEASRRLRDAILANISHEFRSPLSAQLASLELLRDRLPELSRDETQTLVLSLERGTLRLTRLIDNLLESTRIEAGRMTLRRQQVALDQVVEEAVEMMSPLVEQRRQSLELDLPFPLPPITGDSARLIQVFVNLLANANKFSGDGTTISIGGEVREREIELWVEDEGPGLPAGPVDAVFERFTRSAADEPAQSGMGLGLWIVKSVVERHGGRVRPSRLDRGTRMSVVLPRELDRAA